MDLRVEKTERAIKNAFLELRSKKPLEKIRIKEMCEKACINKSTFYAHYPDIYGLSDAIEMEVVESIMNDIPVRNPAKGNIAEFTRELTYAFTAQSSLINMLFSGSQQSHLANRIEKSIKERIFKEHPEFEKEVYWNVLLSYCIQGAYWAFQGNREYDGSQVVEIISKVTQKIQPLYEEEKPE